MNSLPAPELPLLQFQAKVQNGLRPQTIRFWSAIVMTLCKKSIITIWVVIVSAHITELSLYALMNLFMQSMLL